MNTELRAFRSQSLAVNEKGTILAESTPRKLESRGLLGLRGGAKQRIKRTLQIREQLGIITLATTRLH